MNLVLIRHAEARAGVDQIIGGPKGCTGLTDDGREQAERLRARLERSNELRADVILASVLRRAIETAEIVRPALGSESPIVTDCDYCELHPGECDGMTWDEARTRYALAENGLGGPDVPMSPGGESERTFDARVRRAVSALQDAYTDQTVVLFTHGGFVTAATLFLFGTSGIHEKDGRLRLIPENTGITEFTRVGEPECRLERYNDAAHLRI